MSIGLIIKQERLKQKIKQTNLAKGICSISYLSKIENNSALPNDEILQLLLIRLNLTIIEPSVEEENDFIRKLSAVYREAILFKDREKVKKFILEVSASHVQFYSISNYYQFNLKLFRLRLIAQWDLEELRDSINFIASFRVELEYKDLFFLNFNLSLYFYEQRDFAKSLSYMENSLNLLDMISIEEWEIADFYNALSVIYGTNHFYTKAIHYANLSLSYFQNSMLLNRAIDCYIVLGNSYKCLQDANNAIKSYTMAQKTAQNLNLKHYEAMLSQNIGSLMVSKGENVKAVEYFLQSLSQKEEGTESYLLTILSLVKIYSKHGNSNEVLHYCNRALELMENTTQRDKQLKTYFMHLTLFKALHNNDEKLENIIKKTVKFFELIGDHHNALKYSFLMADYYYQNKKYKASAIYQEKIRQILFARESINHWEEL